MYAYLAVFHKYNFLFCILCVSQLSVMHYALGTYIQPPIHRFGRIFLLSSEFRLNLLTARGRETSSRLFGYAYDVWLVWPNIDPNCVAVVCSFYLYWMFCPERRHFFLLSLFPCIPADLWSRVNSIPSRTLVLLVNIISLTLNQEYQYISMLVVVYLFICSCSLRSSRNPSL